MVLMRIFNRGLSKLSNRLRLDNNKLISLKRILRRDYTDYHELAKKYFDLPEPVDGKNFPKLSAKDTAKYIQPPTETRMLAREFIDDCLYNPHYGYFSKQAVIYSPDTPVQFQNIQDSMEFLNIVADKYKDIEDDISNVNDIARQVWHTPTELFKPHYGNSIAKYIVTEFLNSPDNLKRNLIIYEMGAGNGTLMLNILDYIRQYHPELYSKTRYRIIEISSKLAERQQENSILRDAIHTHHNISIINRSIFEWDTKVTDPCFFIALEVLDNFAHDVIRYDTTKKDSPLQGVVLTSKNGDYEEVYEPMNDPLIEEYLTLRNQTDHQPPVLSNPKLRHLKAKLPFVHSLTDREFLPTRSYQFIKLLHQYFPGHRLIMSDFYKLPDTIEGTNGPVVQTRFRKTMVPCSTYLVQPGWFDIFFPTDFELFQKIYHLLPTLSPSPSSTTSSQVLTQSEFLLQYGNLTATTTKSGEIPFLTYYENNKFFLS